MDHASRARLTERYGAGPGVLRAAWEACPPEAWHWKPAENDWSAHDIVIHCGDSETFAATRIRLLAAEPQPVIIGYDQEAWVSAFAYDTLSTELAFATIAAMRASTHDLIRRLDDRAWSASGQHSESGPYTAEDWLVTYAAHLHDHADQIRTNVEDWQERSGEGSR